MKSRAYIGMWIVLTIGVQNEALSQRTLFQKAEQFLTQDMLVGCTKTFVKRIEVDGQSEEQTVDIRKVQEELTFLKEYLPKDPSLIEEYEVKQKNEVTYAQANPKRIPLQELHFGDAASEKKLYLRHTKGSVIHSETIEIEISGCKTEISRRKKTLWEKPKTTKVLYQPKR